MAKSVFKGNFNIEGQVGAGLEIQSKSVFNPDFIKQQEDTLSKYETDYETLDKTIEDDYKKYIETEKQLEQLEIDLQEAPEEMIWNKTQKFNQVKDLHNSLVDKIKANTAEQKKVYELYTTVRDTQNKQSFQNYKQLTGLPGETGIATPLPKSKLPGETWRNVPNEEYTLRQDRTGETFLNAVPEATLRNVPPEPDKIAGEPLDLSVFGLTRVPKSKIPEPVKKVIQTLAGQLGYKITEPEQYRVMKSIAKQIERAKDFEAGLATAQEVIDGTPREDTYKILKSKASLQYKWNQKTEKYDYEPDPKLLNEYIQARTLAGQAGEFTTSNIVGSTLQAASQDILMGVMVANVISVLSKVDYAGIWNDITIKVEGKTVSGKALQDALYRVNYPGVRGEPSEFDRKLFDGFVNQGGFQSVSERLKQGVTVPVTSPRFAFGTSTLYSNLPVNEIIKVFTETGNIAKEVIIDPIKVSQVTQQLLNTSPALASAFLKAVEKPVTPEVSKEETISGLPAPDEALLKKIDQKIPVDLKAEVSMGANLNNVAKILNKAQNKIISLKVQSLKADIESKGEAGLFGAKATAKWVVDFQKGFNREPTDADLKVIAVEQLTKGYEEVGGKVAIDEKFLKIDSALKQIAEVQKPEDRTLDMFNPVEVREGEQLKEGAKPIPKELEPLAEEARKYGSAEEFVKDYKKAALTGFPEGLNNILYKLQSVSLKQKLHNSSELVIKYYGDIDSFMKLTSGSKESISYINESLTDFYTQATTGVKAVGKGEVTIPVTEKTAGVETPAPVKEVIDQKYQTIKDELTQLKESIKLSKIKGKEIAGVKKELDIYIRKMPPPIRGRMFTDYMNIKTQVDLDNAIIKMNKLIENHFSKEYVALVEDELKAKYIAPKKNVSHILAGKFTPEVQRLLDTIKAGVYKPRSNALNQIKENIKLFNSGEKTSIVAENALLSIQGIKEMNLPELRNTLEEIKSIKLTGKMIRVEQEAQRKANLEIEVTKALKVITGKNIELDENGNAKIGTAYKTLPTNRWDRGLINQAKKMIDAIINWQVGGDSLMDKLGALDKTSKPYDSDLSKLWNKDISEPKTSEIIGRNEDIQKLQKGFRDAYNLPKKKDILNKTTENKKEIDLGTFKNSEGDKLPPFIKNKEQLIKKYMQLEDPTLKDTFDKGMLYTEEIKNAIRKAITPEDLKYIDTIKEVYQNVWEKVNPVYGERYGVDFPNNPNYSGRILREVNDINKSESDLLIDNLMDYASILNPSLKARTKSNQTLKYDEATPALLKYITQMEHFIAFAKPLQEVNGVFKDSRVKAIIKSNYGNNIYNKIDGFIKDITNDAIDKGKIVHWLDAIRYNFTRSVLAKPMVGVKMGVSLMTYMTEMPLGDYFKGTSNFWKHPIRNTRFLMNNSPKLKEEIGTGYDRDVHEAMRKGWDKVLANSNKLSDYMFIIGRMSDATARLTGMWAKFYSETNGKCILDTKENINSALRAAEKSTDRTQASFALETKVEPQRGGSFMKAMTMFTDEPNKYFRIIADNTRNFKYGRGSRMTNAKNIILAWVVLPAIFTFIASGGKLKKKDLWKLAFGPLTSMLVFGQLMTSIIGWLSDETYNYLATPVESTINEIQLTLQKISKWKDPTKDMTTDDFTKMIEHFAIMAGELTGLPTPYAVQVKGAIEDKDWRQLLYSKYVLGITKDKKKIGAPDIESLFNKLRKGTSSDSNTKDMFKKLRSK
ncbi:MAG: hypothetical protein MUP69_10270 [Candidatus Atribacteria bacterium]|nr:hypothetical protein [Candidatus Atribacteria bacterium]